MNKGYLSTDTWYARFTIEKFQFIANIQVEWSAFIILLLWFLN